MIRYFKHYYRLKKYPAYKANFEKEQEFKKILSIPRYLTGRTNLLGKEMKFVDSASFQFIYQEIFEKEIYKFNTDNPKPYIIDAGANIGLGIIYFKKLFPDADIIAFEPDNNVFEVLEYNVNSFQFSNIELVKKALWNEETTLKFYSEGADGGRIANKLDEKNIKEIQTIRLASFLQRKVDFLKIDIEGAETTVLESCADLLLNVERLFVEYHSFVNKNQELGKLVQILENAGFRLIVNSPGLTSYQPFVNKTEYLGMDMQLNIYAQRT